jgi:non-reducing end alpha-L-arabinofuranosidase
MKVQSAVLATVVALGLGAAACNSFSSNSSGAGGSSSNGGTIGAGGTSSSGGAVGAGGTATGGTAGGSCSNVTPCGGSLIGTWNVTSSCLEVTGQLDLSILGSGCSSAPVTGALQVTGSWTGNTDGTYVDNTVTTGNEQFTLAPACLVISSTPVSCDGAAGIIRSLGYASVNCSSAAGGGCTCAATVQQSGWAGLISYLAASGGSYATAGSVLTLDTSGEYSYCVSGGKMTWTPQTTSPTTTGTIVLGAGATGGGGSSGSGGTVGLGGSSGQGGAVGSGGTIATGGASGTGGAKGTGGASGSGGTTATGGTGGSGGVNGTGGATGSGGSPATGGTNGTAGSSGATGPCDIYKNGGTPCVAAHSTVRALYGAYSGKLYQVRNAAGMTQDISAGVAGGVANGPAQDTFCSGTTCVITIVYDQTGKGNDLWYQGSGSPGGGEDKAASATGESIKVGGSKVYSLYINAGNSYWVDGSQQGVPMGSAPEGMYMVTSGKHYNTGCCFDYGNSESDRKADGAGAMDALNLSAITAWGTGAGSGPWVMADLEYGIFAQNNTSKNQNDPSQTSTFVTAVLKNNGTTEFTLKGSDATTGSLATYYKGALPSGWSPMKKQGAIVLGSGGDCCATNTNISDGTFYEGCLVSGYPTDATEDAVQANIVAARYGQ